MYSHTYNVGVTKRGEGLFCIIACQSHVFVWTRIPAISSALLLCTLLSYRCRGVVIAPFPALQNRVFILMGIVKKGGRHKFSEEFAVIGV